MNHKKRCFGIAGALALAALSTPALAATVHVAPDGNDAWSGVLPRPNAKKTDGPVASLIGARNKIRALKSKRKRGAANKDRVLVASGTYAVRAPLVLTPQDSGTVYEAAPNAKPVFSGGRVLAGWKAGADGIWSTQIPEVKSGAWNFEQLWVNGKRATRARTPSGNRDTPNEVYLLSAGDANAANDPTKGDAATFTHRAFMARPEDVAVLKSLSPQEFEEATVVVYHSWETSRHHIAGVDWASGTVALKGSVWAKGATWWPISWGNEQRYVLEGFRAALDAPGEWFLDRPSGTLFYKPRLGEEIATARVLAPVADSFIEIKGDASAGKLVIDVSFKGLAFRFGQYVLPAGGHADVQAEVTVPAAIMLDGARRVSFEDCEVSHIGIYAMWFRNGCRDNKVTRTLMQDLGAGGVKIGEAGAPDQAADKILVSSGNASAGTTGVPNAADKILAAQQTSHITLDNNIISGGGQIHHGANGVWIGQSGDNNVTHNEIGDFTYTGISVGWRWGYGESLAKRNKIEFNHIHHIGQGVLSDMGAVYTLGPSEGTTVSNNRVHDVESYYLFGGWGLYTDEGSSFIVLENNLVYNTKTAPFRQHYGRENIIRNNILAYGERAQMQRTNIEEHLSLSFERNIVYSGGAAIWIDNWIDKVATRSNLYWTQPGDAALPKLLAERQAAGQDAASIVADPNFVNADARDFRLKPDSPALKIGFVPFDFSRAGVYGKPEWKKLASRVAMPASVELTAARPGNLAFGKPSEIRSIDDLRVLGSQFGMPAAHAVDARFETVAQATNEFPWTFRVDLESVQTLRRAIVSFGNGWATEYEIAVSSDGANWTRVAYTSEGKPGERSFDFPAIQARYVRVRGLKPDGAVQLGGQMSIAEFQVFEKEKASL